MNNLDDLDSYVHESIQSKTLILNNTATKNSIKNLSKACSINSTDWWKIDFRGQRWGLCGFATSDG